MFEDPVPTWLIAAIEDRFDAEELVTLLALDAKDIVVAFPDEINDKLDSLKSELGIEDEDEEDDEYAGA